jgi:uncharacterized protein
MDVREQFEHCLEADADVRFALLYGSRARGTERSGSDWDVAVFLRPELTAEERFRARVRITARLQNFAPVDVTVLNDAPPLLAHRALQGTPLLIRDRTDLVRFFVHTLGAAEDDRHFRGLHRAARRRRVEEGRFGRP